MAVKTITFDDYRNRVKGGWAGKIVGGTLGGPFEGERVLHDFDDYQTAPTEGLENDDLDIQLIWLHALQDRGPYIDETDLMEEWRVHSLFANLEYGVCTENLRKGIYPPLSGKFNNDLFHNGMGSPIRAEIWGLTCPGNPGLAAEYAEYDAQLDHWDSSVHGEQFIAAMEAAAFFESDADHLLDVGLAAMPPDAKLHQVIGDVRAWHTDDPDGDWRFCRRRILNRYGAPDMTNCRQNLAFIVMCMLYSRMEFTSGMLMAVNAGYDTDCTCATFGSIYGVAHGFDAIPGRWMDPLGDTFRISSPVQNLPKEGSLEKLTDNTVAVGCEMALTRNDAVTIEGAPEIKKVRGPKKVKPVTIRVEYDVDPALGIGEMCGATIVVSNHSKGELEDTLTITGPDYLDIDPGSADLVVPPGETVRKSISVSVPESCNALPPINLCEAVFGRAKHTFGFSGSTPYKAFGLFPNEDGGGLEVPFLNEPGGIHRDTPAGTSDLPHYEVKSFNWPIEVMDLDAVFGAWEPWVMYLLRYIQCPHDYRVVARVSISDGYKLWVNDELVREQHEHRFPSPQRYEFDLKEGENKLLFKIARCTQKIDFTVRLLDKNDPDPALAHCGDYFTLKDIVNLRP